MCFRLNIQSMYNAFVVTTAYDLSGEKVFLEKATQLGNLLLPAFRTRTGIPLGMVNFHTGEGSGGWAGNSAILSELGTLQVDGCVLPDVNSIFPSMIISNALQCNLNRSSFAI